LLDAFPTLDDQSVHFKTENTGNVYTLLGVVTNANTGQPLGGSTVTLFDANTRSIVIDSFTSNATGFYQLEVPQALGVYYMTATRVNYNILAPASVTFLPGNPVFENQVINLAATPQ